MPGLQAPRELRGLMIDPANWGSRIALTKTSLTERLVPRNTMYRCVCPSGKFNAERAWTLRHGWEAAAAFKGLRREILYKITYANV